LTIHTDDKHELLKAVSKSSGCQEQNLFGATLERPTLASERLLDASGSLWIGRFQSVQQSVGAYFEKLGEPCERRHSKGKTAVFNRPDSLHMNTRQFSKAFLGQASIQTGLADVPAKHAQDFAIVHSQSEQRHFES
jgi:hypothetical protein